ncbi:MAG: exonuclease domain-containing protein, partial [Paracoccaceae bacterium]
ELANIGMPTLPNDRAIDTVLIARKKFPGSPASLDALCRRFGVDNAARQKHGALLDSELLAEVYLELIGGRQPDFGLSTSAVDRGTASDVAAGTDWRPAPRPTPLPSSQTDEEAQAHAAFVAKMGEAALWNQRG